MPPRRTSKRRKRSDSSISTPKNEIDDTDTRNTYTESDLSNLESYARLHYTGDDVDYINNVRFHLKDDGTCATFLDNNDNNVSEEFWKILKKVEEDYSTTINNNKINDDDSHDKNKSKINIMDFESEQEQEQEQDIDKRERIGKESFEECVHVNIDFKVKASEDTYNDVSKVNNGNIDVLMHHHVQPSIHANAHSNTNTNTNTNANTNTNTYTNTNTCINNFDHIDRQLMEVDVEVINATKTPVKLQTDTQLETQNEAQLEIETKIDATSDDHEAIGSTKKNENEGEVDENNNYKDNETTILNNGAIAYDGDAVLFNLGECASPSASPSVCSVHEIQSLSKSQPPQLQE